MLPALSLDGIIWAKIVEGSFTKPLFLALIEDLLTRMQPFPGRNSVIIMDNARIHKNQEVVDMIHERLVQSTTLYVFGIMNNNHFDRGMRVLFLPPYSPDYNPIELAFSSIKAYVRCTGVLTREDVNQEEDDMYVVAVLAE